MMMQTSHITNSYNASADTVLGDVVDLHLYNTDLGQEFESPVCIFFLYNDNMSCESCESSSLNQDIWVLLRVPD